MWGPVVVYSTCERDKVIQQFPLIRSYDYVELAIDFRWGPTLARKDIDAACEEQSRASVVTNIFSRQRCGADGRAFIYSKSTIVNTAKNVLYYRREIGRGGQPDRIRSPEGSILGSRMSRK